MNWKQSFALGLCSVGEYKGEPVAYLYNGVRLPKLPEWDKSKYPYVFIFYNDVQNLYVLRFGTENVEYGYFLYTITADMKEVYEWGWKLPEGAEYANCTYKEANSDNWSEIKEYGQEYFPHVDLPIVWTANDILNVEDGTVYAKATDPIPVYA